MFMEARIQKLISYENLTPTKFADIIGVQRSAISHILSGRNKPSFDLIQKILNKFPRISSEWLLMGRGEMYKTMVQQRLFDVDQKTNDIKIEVKPPVIQENTPNISIHKEAENSVNDSSIERIIIFYKDKSFKEYVPGK
ncbi:MAG: helix-turn-helix transcriptional regulator [Bacteroidales bacterium]|nr:helix-turn-helix transcriptional regulator [Bacteroidales bacterium]